MTGTLGTTGLRCPGVTAIREGQPVTGGSKFSLGGSRRERGQALGLQVCGEAHTRRAQLSKLNFQNYSWKLVLGRKASKDRHDYPESVFGVRTRKM